MNNHVSYKPVLDPFPGKGPIPAGTPGFYKRAEVLTTVQDLLRAGDSVSLVGERKAGKTSFLNYLQANLSLDEFVPVFVDAQSIAPKTDQTFLGVLVRKASQALARIIGIETGNIVKTQEPTQDYFGRLLQLLDGRFNEGELKNLCFHLGVDYDNLPDIGKANKARELILHLQRRERIPNLIQVGQRLRPEVPWEDPPPPDKTSQTSPLEMNTLKVQANEAYFTFHDDLDRLRDRLPRQANGQKRRLVWLIDEIEILRGYEKTELFTFLRPLAQSDPDFRMVVAGYDVLYTLATRSKWSPFYNAFRHVRLEGLNPVVAQELIDDALATMGVTVEQELYGAIFNWTGQKPFFLKWLLSQIAGALNRQQQHCHVNEDILQSAQSLFLDENDLKMYFVHLWQAHTTSRQQIILSLMAVQPGPYAYPQIFDQLKNQRLLAEDELTPQNLVDDLTRLQQLGFLYEQVGRYTFTSSCLQVWIARNRPLPTSV